jgi:hypothetical protein
MINNKFKLIARNLLMYAREDGTIQMEIKCSNIKDDNKHANANEVLLCEYNATTSFQAHDGTSPLKITNFVKK